MEKLGWSGTGSRPAIMALISISCFLLSDLAQVAHSQPRADAAASRSRSDAGPERGETSDLFINTHDVSGILGTSLPLKFELIRTGEVSIEAIHLLGLPQGVKISDMNNTFFPLDSKEEVDISKWDFAKIQITQTVKRESSFPLAVAAIWSPEPGGRIDVATSLLNVSFLPDGPDRTVASGESRSLEKLVNANSEKPSAHVITSPMAPDTSAMTKHTIVLSARGELLRNTMSTDRLESAAVTENRPAPKDEAARLAHPMESARPTLQVDPLVERAKSLIRLGDISGARLLLERAQARNAPNATFLLAQTWDPAMLRRWNVRGLRADPDLAKSLYAKAAVQHQPNERLLAATGR